MRVYGMCAPACPLYLWFTYTVESISKIVLLPLVPYFNKLCYVIYTWGGGLVLNNIRHHYTHGPHCLTAHIAATATVWCAISNSHRMYRGAGKSLARPARKLVTATGDFEFRISYL